MTEQPKRVDLSTPDIALENRDALAALFPGVLADGVLDTTRLSELLEVKVTSPADGRERFGLMWAGKQEAVRSLLTQSRGTLVPDLAKSVDFDNAQNVFIEGDNLEVLKLLQKAYNDKVKLIYIDPPYNTGNDFVYNDDFSDGLRGYLEYTGQLDEEGNRTSAQTDTSGRRHSKWLTMMYPRLVLARNLLTQDGVLLCSINDREYPNLVALLNEIFGEENFLATFIWNNDGNIEQQSAVKVNHEYIVAFARNIDCVEKPTIIDPNVPEDSKLYNEQIENSITKNGPKNPESTVRLPEGFPASEDHFTLQPRDNKYPHILDEIVVTGGQLTKSARVRSGWSSRRLLDLYIENGFVPIEDQEGKESWFSLTGTGAIYGYKRRSESQGHVLTVLRNMGTTKASSSGLKKRWGVLFDFPKPERLIQHLVSVFTKGDDLVLDFFAGSGTTAHAVALQNEADSGSRRFVLINLPEPVEADSAAGRAGFESIAEITVRRIHGVISDVVGASDLGLRVFSLASSQFRQGNSSDPEGLFDLSESTLRTVDSDLEAVVVEVLLKEGVSLDQTLERPPGCVISGGVAVVQSVDHSDEIVEAVLALDTRVVVFLEDGFAEKDAVKTNAYARARELGITMKTI